VSNVIRDVVDDINKTVGKRWHGLDPLLPEPGDLPEGCMEPLVVKGEDGRPAGVGICFHQRIPDDSLLQTWGPANQYVLSLRLCGPDTFPAADELLTQWRDHLAGIPEAGEPDTGATVSWPSRDVTGVRALLRHGLQATTVIATRTARPVPPAAADAADAAAGLLIRPASPDDLDAVTELELGVAAWDAQFGSAIVRPATEALMRRDAQAYLAKPSPWTWLAERDRRPVGLVVVQPPQDAAWIAGMTSAAAPAYLSSMFVRPDERGSRVGAALVKRAHDELDAHGVAVTLLHHGQMNPVSAPFWYRMGYRPLWTTWDTRPAATLR
jgi:GNAT superfamily N-acetyltransferase